ncbi:TetR/AcrR family transcriptional regulator [Amycolatopsis taiwanensis]|uniref:TetR family transcriptional regulator n=1 Tax=Amycolatopsis taiwanensis TaxID=342230 RepID=A0A9W6QZJ5_9PSEU|nr:TetR/AcrR family transcriptional regulator [Amycolatopsis taiwanensis]GLY65503.1 TetR family transcriptional regulator [Amycolatopsis taiwanensis]
MAVNENGGLRERKKVATRKALREAALRLALEHGPDNVRVDDIAEAAGVSPRTYNNYFSSREQAIVAAINAERALRITAALRARPEDEPLARAVVEAVVEQYTSEPAGDALTLITSTPRLCAEFTEAVSAIRQPLASAIADRIGGDDVLAPAVLAAAISAAVRVAIEHWIRPAGDAPKGLLVVVGERPLAGLLREALAHVEPALQAADPRHP